MAVEWFAVSIRSEISVLHRELLPSDASVRPLPELGLAVPHESPFASSPDPHSRCDHVVSQFSRTPPPLQPCGWPSCAAASASVSHRKISNNLDASIATEMARFFGVRNCSQLRTRANGLSCSLRVAPVRALFGICDDSRIASPCQRPVSCAEVSTNKATGLLAGR